MKYEVQHPIIPNDERILATFWQRAFAILIDAIIVTLLCAGVIAIGGLFGIDLHLFHFNFTVYNPEPTTVKEGISLLKEDENNISKRILFGILEATPTIYFALVNYFTNGRTLGKWVMRIRIASIYHQRISFWHCVERALGYAASTLEAGLGFLQVFWNPNRMCLHDRIAETIVIQERRVVKVKK